MSNATQLYVCPICGSDDATCSVRSAIWGDTSVHRTSGVTIGWVDPNQTTTSYYTTMSQGELAYELGYPSKPFSFIWFGILLVVGVIFMWVPASANVISESLVGTDSTMGIVFASFMGIILGLILGGLPGIVLGVQMYLVMFLVTIPFRLQWKNREKKYLSSGYCYRDEVIFDDEVALPPREYVQHIFG